MNLTLLYIHAKAVIPAEAGIQRRKTGFRVKPGMTIIEKGLMIHYTSYDLSIDVLIGSTGIPPLDAVDHPPLRSSLRLVLTCNLSHNGQRII